MKLGCFQGEKQNFKVPDFLTQNKAGSFEHFELEIRLRIDIFLHNLAYSVRQHRLHVFEQCSDILF
jgi:hypothetical protein